jgi:hypothetical protein
VPYESVAQGWMVAITALLSFFSALLVSTVVVGGWSFRVVAFRGGGPEAATFLEAIKQTAEDMGFDRHNYLGPAALHCGGREH